MTPDSIDKLSINLGFMEAQAVGTFAIGALVLIVVLLLGWTIVKQAWRRP